MLLLLLLLLLLQLLVADDKMLQPVYTALKNSMYILTICATDLMEPLSIYLCIMQHTPLVRYVE